MVPFRSVFVLSLTLAIAHSVDLSNIIGNYLEEQQEETTILPTPTTITTIDPSAIPTSYITEETFWIPNIRDVVTQFNLFAPQTNPVPDVTEPVDNVETTTTWVLHSNTTPSTLTTLVPDLEEATTFKPINQAQEQEDTLRPIEWNPSVDLSVDLAPPSTNEEGEFNSFDSFTKTTETLNDIQTSTTETIEVTTQVPDLEAVTSLSELLEEAEQPQKVTLKPIEWNSIEELSEDLTPPSASPVAQSSTTPLTTLPVLNPDIEGIKTSSASYPPEETTIVPELEEITTGSNQPQPGQIYGEILVGDKAPLVEDDPNGVETNNLTPMAIEFPCLDSKASMTFINESSDLDDTKGSPGLVFTSPTSKLGQNGVTFERVIVRGVCCWETFRRIRFTGKMIRICPGNYQARDIAGSVWRIQSLRPVDHFAQRRKELQDIDI